MQKRRYTIFFLPETSRDGDRRPLFSLEVDGGANKAVAEAIEIVHGMLDEHPGNGNLIAYPAGLCLASQDCKAK